MSGGLQEPFLSIPVSNQAAQKVASASSSSPLAASPGTFGAQDLVQFATSVFFAKENDGMVGVEVVRYGDLKSPCSVRCFTKDLSGKAGQRYKAIDQQLTFSIGENWKEVRIPILLDPAWHPCEEFSVNLDAATGCSVEGSLQTSRVKILDEDCFPSNKYKEQIESGELHEVSTTALMWSFFWLASYQPGIKLKSIIIICVGLLHNLQYLLTIYLKVYLVNVLLAHADGSFGKHHGGHESEAEEEEGGGFFGDDLLIPGSLKGTALVVGALYIGPFAVLHLIDYIMSERLDVAGQLRAMLQLGLFRRYMSYSHASRTKVSDSEIAMASVQAAAEIVDNGFMKGYAFIQLVGKLMIVAFFLLTENPLALIPLLLYPILAAIWIKARANMLRETNEEREHSELQMVQSVHQATVDCQLIFDYSLRSKAVDLHEKCVNRVKSAIGAVSTFRLNNGYFFPWLTTISMASYVYLGVQEIAAGRSSVGTFVATFAIFQEVGTELTEGYDSIVEQISAFELLRPVTQKLNLATDDAERMEATRRRLSLGRAARDELRTMAVEELASRNAKFREDLIQIKLTDVTFRHGQHDILKSMNLSAPQGSTVAVIGPEREGKATLMRLLSQALQPQDGLVFIPPHLRVLNVGDTPHILKASLLKNLTYGVSQAQSRSHRHHGAFDAPERLREICARLKMGKSLLQLLEKELMEAEAKEHGAGGHADHPNHGSHATHNASHDGHEGHGEHHHTHYPWIDALTHTDRMLIHLARAFIANPNVMVIHRPLMRFFSHEMRETIMTIMQEFARNGGVALDKHANNHQQPRTVFFSSAHSQEAKEADIVWRLKNGRITVEQGKRNGLLA